MDPYINLKISRGSKTVNMKFEALQSGKLVITTKHSKVDLAPELDISGVPSLDDEKIDRLLKLAVENIFEL